MNLKEYRKKNKLTQAEAGKIIGKSGTGYGHYETGVNEPDINSLIKLADFYKVTLDELVGHPVPFVLSKIDFTDKQLELIEKIKNLSDRQCEKTEAYVLGLESAGEEK